MENNSLFEDIKGYKIEKLQNEYNNLNEFVWEYVYFTYILTIISIYYLMIN